MVLEFRYGQMVQSTKVNGKTIKPMAKVNFGMQMEMFMKETGKMIRQMASESTFMLMGLAMRVNGKMIYKMAGEWKAGQMEANTKVDTRKE